jgi:predicted O-linked N-acetylglucosamine transferase (SPINDLY family)
LVHSDTLFQRAKTAFEARDWERAEDLLETLLEEDTAHPAGNLLMGQLAGHADCFEEARTYAKVALSQIENRSGARQVTQAARALLGLASRALAFPALRAGKLAHAIELCQEALASDAKDAEIWAWLATAWSTAGFPEEARQAFQHRLRLMPNDEMVLSQWIVLLSGDSATDAETLAKWCRKWDQRFGRRARPLDPPPELARRTTGDLRMRIGFYSTTLREHAISCFLLPLLEHLDRQRYAIYAFHDGGHEDAVTARIRGLVDGFSSVNGQSSWQIAEKIRATGVDILIDLNGFFDNARQLIFAHRPAPIQAHYLGGAGPSGIGAIDWWIVDDLSEPKKASPRIPEQIFHLEGGLHAYAPLHSKKEPSLPPSAQTQQITFGSFQWLQKMEKGVLRTWGQVLAAVPESRLLLIKDSFADTDSRDLFRKRAVAAGIDPKRLVLRPLGTGESFEDGSAYQAIDIALDTFPYNGITSTCESLWMGVPVVCLRGDRFVAREAAAILERVGHSEWIAGSPEDYIAIAATLAAAPEKLLPLRRALRQEFRASPVADGARLAHEMGRFFDSLSG